jgi:signal transduction histidine kinase
MPPVLLQQVLPLVHAALQSGIDPTAGILQLIRTHFKLEDVVLKLFYFQQGTGLQISAADGHWRPLNIPLGMIEKQILVGRSAATVAGLHIRPLPLPGNPLGFLQFPVPDESLLVVLDAELEPLVDQLSLLLLARQGWEKSLIRSFPLMPADLSRLSGPDELLSLLGRRMFGYNRTQAVVLRPLHGGTVLGDGWSFVVPGQRRWTKLYLHLEEEHAGDLVNSGEAMIYRQLEHTADQPATFRPSMLVLPLIGTERLLGTLTFFGGDWPTAEDGELAVESLRSAEQFAAVVAIFMERTLAREESAYLSAEREAKLQESSTLLRIARAMHSTLRLNELTHLILSAAVSPRGGGFERAMLFMLNARSQTLQGMLGVDRKTSSLLLPDKEADHYWQKPNLSAEVLGAQRTAPVNRIVLKQRLPLDGQDNPLAQAACSGKVILVQHPATESPSEAVLAGELRLAPYACVPLQGKEHCFGVLVLDNPQSREVIASGRIRFLEIFASQAGAAMENAQLLGRLEHAHRDLMETQEKLIQGERLAVLGEMSATVAHELKNPLVSIGGFARRLERLDPGDPRQTEYSGIIATEVSRMEALLRNILSFSKQHMLCLAPCNLSAVVSESLQLVAETIAGQNIRLEERQADDLPLIQADAQKLRQVLLNLLSNACHAMPDGGILRLRTRRCLLRGQPAVEIEVEDTGEGIPAELMRNIFNPFFTTKEQGTGLGLSISHRIIEHHLGEIEVTNTETGARFLVRLPVTHPAAPQVDKGDDFS